MATKPADQFEDLLEFVPNPSGALRVDREASTIHGVKILGLSSKNGREYSEAAVARAAPLYEGKVVNVDHLEGQGARRASRSYRDVLGRLSSVHYKPGQGLYGDLKVNPKHAVAEQLFWDAEHAPENVGLSHDVRGRISRVGGKSVVEEIEAVRSVDVVATPASTASLFESVTDEPGGENAMEMKDITEATLASERPDLIKSLTATITKEIAESAEAKAQATELLQLREKVKTFEADAEKSKLRELITEELKAAKLDPADENAVSPIFVEMLVAESDAARRKTMIEDRVKLTEGLPKPGTTTTPKPKSIAPGAGGGGSLPKRELTEAVAGWRG